MLNYLGFIRIWLLTSTKFGFEELMFNFSQIYILRQYGTNKMFVQLFFLSFLSTSAFQKKKLILHNHTQGAQDLTFWMGPLGADVRFKHNTYVAHNRAKHFLQMDKNYNAPSKILDEYSELARNKVMKTRASRVNAIFEFYTTRLAR